MDSTSPPDTTKAPERPILDTALFALLAFMITWGTGMLIVLSSHASLVNGAHQAQHPIPLPFPIAITLQNVEQLIRDNHCLVNLVAPNSCAWARSMLLHCLSIILVPAISENTSLGPQLHSAGFKLTRQSQATRLHNFLQLCTSRGIVSAASPGP